MYRYVNKLKLAWFSYIVALREYKKHIDHLLRMATKESINIGSNGGVAVIESDIFKACQKSINHLR